jgi:pimeloyl-ACP methyl ester carboxylesterase
MDENTKKYNFLFNLNFFVIIVKVNNKNLKYFKNVVANIKMSYKILLYAYIVIIAIFLTNGITINLFTNVFAQMKQNQMQQILSPINQTSLILQNQSSLQGNSITIDNMTFSHNIASVNGIQLHYVIGGHGDPIVLLHGWPETWYTWHNIMPALAKNYTVIAPDLRGLGDSSKPPTGYDGKTAAEDIHQLVGKLGFKTIFLVGHDIGTQVAYSYAAAHPTEVKKLVVMELTIPGFGPPGRAPIWWGLFHQVPNVPEALVQGKEMLYLSWFYQGLAYNPSAIKQADINEYVNHYSAPGGMHAGFEYYRAFPQDAIDNQNYSKTKLTMPVLAIGGGYIPVLGGNITMPSVVYGMNILAQNVQGIKVPNTGHFIPEEQPQFIIKQISNFFGKNNTTNTK